MNKNKLILFVFAAAALIAADQITKYLIRTSGGFYICNRVFAFGMTFPYILFFFLIFIVFLIMTNLQCQMTNRCQMSKFKIFVIRILELIRHLKFVICHSKSYGLATILIFSGALSNIIDRIMSGCVIDFIDLKLWPIFNLADIYISAGVILILINLIGKNEH